MSLEERGLIVIDILTEEGLRQESGLLEIGLIAFGLEVPEVPAAELEEALFAYLSTYGSLTALVSTRIYPLILPQSPTYPVITYQRIDGPREHGLTAEHEMAHPRIQVDSWGKTYASVKAVATEAREALERWADESSNPVVLDSFLDNDEDSYEPDTGLHRIRQDWIIWHRET